MSNEDKDHEFAIVYKAGLEQLDALEEEMDAEREETQELLAQSRQLLKKRGVTVDESTQNEHLHDDGAPSSELAAQDWDELVNESRDALPKNVDSPLTTVDLLPDEHLRDVYQRLDRPLYKRLEWDRWDYIVSFGVGGLGALLNAFVGTPGQGLQRMMADKNHWVGSFGVDPLSWTS